MRKNSMHKMKCPYCGKLLTSSSYNNHKNNTNCLYHRKGIYYCKCEKFATDKYHDFLNHARGCLNYEYDETKINRFDFSFEELYQIEKSKVELYEKILTDLLGSNVRSLINIDNVLKKYKLDEYNEKFVTESEKSEEEYKKIKEELKEEIKEEANIIIHELSCQEAFDQSIQSIIEKRIFIEPILLSVSDEELESIVDICGYDDHIKLIFCFNTGLIKEGMTYMTKKTIDDLVEYQQSFTFNNPGSLSIAYFKYLFYLTDLSFLTKYLENIYERKSDHIDTFISNVDNDEIHRIFQKCYTEIFGVFEYKTELKDKDILYNFFLNLVCLDYIVLFYLFVSHGKISVDDIKFTFDSGNQLFAEDKIYVLKDILNRT